MSKPLPKAWKHAFHIVKDHNNEVDSVRSVRVLAVAEGWAMVRRKGCRVYCCRVDELRPDTRRKRSE